MWICLNNAFFSIVEHYKHKDHLLVRSRWPKDINKIWPKENVEHTPQNDYPYRAVIKREQVALAIANKLKNINYTNFKSSAEQIEVTNDDKSRTDAYHDAWHVINKHGRKGKYNFGKNNNPWPPVFST